MTVQELVQRPEGEEWDRFRHHAKHVRHLDLYAGFGEYADDHFSDYTEL